jgi:hypothetical protein
VVTCRPAVALTVEVEVWLVFDVLAMSVRVMLARIVFDVLVLVLVLVLVVVAALALVGTAAASPVPAMTATTAKRILLMAVPRGIACGCAAPRVGGVGKAAATALLTRDL